MKFNFISVDHVQMNLQIQLRKWLIFAPVAIFLICRAFLLSGSLLSRSNLYKRLVQCGFETPIPPQ